jgi:hypothetical protein
LVLRQPRYPVQLPPQALPRTALLPFRAQWPSPMQAVCVACSGSRFRRAPCRFCAMSSPRPATPSSRRAVLPHLLSVAVAAEAPAATAVVARAENVLRLATSPNDTLEPSPLSTYPERLQLLALAAKRHMSLRTLMGACERGDRERCKRARRDHAHASAASVQRGDALCRGRRAGECAGPGGCDAHTG